jgi:LysM domain-containing protein
MINPDSRYQDSVKTFTTGHTYDAFGRIYLNGDDPTPVPRNVVNETLYRLTVRTPPVVSPVEYMVKEGESMAFVAWKLLAAHSSWWKVAEANQNVWYPLDLRPGAKLKVPL